MVSLDFYQQGALRGLGCFGRVALVML